MLLTLQDLPAIAMRRFERVIMAMDYPLNKDAHTQQLIAQTPFTTTLHTSNYIVSHAFEERRLALMLSVLPFEGKFTWNSCLDRIEGRYSFTGRSPYAYDQVCLVSMQKKQRRKCSHLIEKLHLDVLLPPSKNVRPLDTQLAQLHHTRLDEVMYRRLATTREQLVETAVLTNDILLHAETISSLPPIRTQKHKLRCDPSFPCL